MNKAVKIRIYPTEQQLVLIEKTFGCCRWMWNKMLSDRVKAYETDKSTIHPTPAPYKKDYDWLKEVDSLALCNTQKYLEAAYKRFFDGIKGKGPKSGFPKYKKKKSSKRSYTTNNQCVSGNYTIEYKDEKLKLPKLGWISCHMYRNIPDGIIKTVTVSEPIDGEYYASIIFELPDTKITNTPITAQSKCLGLDYASKGLYVDSEGNNCDMPRFYRQSEKKLAKLQRELSRKQKGSNNYNKQKSKVHKQHIHVANQRKDYLHKTSTEIANQYDAVFVEDINMSAISRSLRLGKSTLDNGFGMFRTMLEYKLAERGKTFLKVDKFFASTQLCHCCGYKNPETKNLKVTEWTCPECKTHHDRNINAAINIKNEGLRVSLSAA